jgi:hypothetical protein
MAMSTERSLEGGCACGEVHYRLSDRPIFVNNCHCRLCQRQTGTGSAVNAFIESDRLTMLSGTLSSHDLPTGSGGVQTIMRCTACGTPLWSYYPRLGRVGAAVRVGTLDDPSALVLDAAIFVADRPAWAPMPEGVPHFEAGYAPADVLPADRLARLQALIAAAAHPAKA